MNKTYTGVVKKVMDKGFGFIKCEELGKDVFYHNNDLPADLRERGLQEGIDKVSFSIKQGPKGESATDIKLVSEDDSTNPMEADDSEEVMAA